MPTPAQKRLLAAGGLALAAAGCWLYDTNTRIRPEHLPVYLPDLPPAFENCRIALLTDLHIPDCTVSPRKLAETVRMLKPDFIFFSGDLITSYKPFNGELLFTYMKHLAAIAPCYAIPGNHERRMGILDAWRLLLHKAGITVLLDEWVLIERDNGELPLCGLLRGIPLAGEHPAPGPVLALSHYPARLDAYESAGLNLVLAGHAHGGQWRFFGQGVFAPGEGLLPRYTSGLYRKGGTQLAVSRGLGNSAFPLRINNPPHIPLLILHNENQAV